MGNGFPGLTFLFFVMTLCLLMTGCTHITYQSDGYIPIFLTQKPLHRHKVEIQGVKEFYLWGNVGPDRLIKLDEEFYNQGILSASEVEVQQYQTLGQFLTAFFSVGFYIPISYKLMAMGAKEGD